MQNWRPVRPNSPSPYMKPRLGPCSRDAIDAAKPIRHWPDLALVHLHLKTLEHIFQGPLLAIRLALHGHGWRLSFLVVGEQGSPNRRLLICVNHSPMRQLMTSREHEEGPCRSLASGPCSAVDCRVPTMLICCLDGVDEGGGSCLLQEAR